jgi:hypothetical protein
MLNMLRRPAISASAASVVKRRPDGNHVEDFLLRLAPDIDAAPRLYPHEAFLVEAHQGLAQRRAADAELFRQAAFVEAEFRVVVVDVHGGDGGLQLVVNPGLEAEVLADGLNP